MKWLSYTWSVISGVIELLIIVNITDKFIFFSSFETFVACALIIIYASIRSFGINSGLAILEISKKERDRFLSLRELINTERFKKEADWDGIVEKDNNDFTKIKVKLFINAIFVFIIYLIGIINLLNN